MHILLEPTTNASVNCQQNVNEHGNAKNDVENGFSPIIHPNYYPPASAATVVPSAAAVTLSATKVVQACKNPLWLPDNGPTVSTKGDWTPTIKTLFRHAETENGFLPHVSFLHKTLTSKRLHTTERRWPQTQKETRMYREAQTKRECCSGNDSENKAWVFLCERMWKESPVVWFLPAQVNFVVRKRRRTIFNSFHPNPAKVSTTAKTHITRHATWKEVCCKNVFATKKVQA